ncbi:MAG: hypothetical protein ACI395_00135 [Candidatus Cryptobacteroides sp.]
MAHLMKYVAAAFLLAASLFQTFGAERAGTMEYKIAQVMKGKWVDPSAKSFELVRNLCDQIIDDGYNTVVIGPFEFLPMEILDYSKTPYPEAAQFPAEKVREQLTTLRSHLSYLKKNGIKHILVRSNSNYAPINFWKAHQQGLNPDGMFDRLLSVAHWNKHYTNSMEGKSPWVAPHMQWRNRTYRDFFLYSTEQVLDLLPEIDGFSNNYSECSWTFDLDMVRKNEWKRWEDCRDLDATGEDFLEWVEAQYEMLKRKRGDDFVLSIRDWYVRPKDLERISQRPNTILEIKYGGYDQPVINYPPWAKDLVDKGFDVTLAIHMYDAEWPYPLYYYSVEHINTMFRNLYDAGFAGFLSLDYINRGDIPDNPVKKLYQTHTSKAMYAKPFTEADAEKFLKPYFGKASKPLLRSMEDVNDAQATYIKLLPSWFWRGDGITATGICPQEYWMFFDNPEAPGRMGFIRQDIVGVPEYVKAARCGEEALENARKQWKEEGRLTPYEAIELMQRKADDAIDAVEKARESAPQDSHRILKDLIANAYVHKVLINRSEAFVKSALYFYLSGWDWNGKYNPASLRTETGMDYVLECRDELNKYLHDDILFRALRREYCKRSPGPKNIPWYGAIRKASELTGNKFVIPELDEDEFDRICDLIEGK